MKPTKANQNQNLGFLPPQALDLEEAVLGAAMMEADGLRSLLSLVKVPEVFYKPAHQEIFRAMQRLSKLNKAVDILTVVSELRDMGKLDEAGGPYGINQLTGRVNSAAHLAAHTAILLEKFTMREIIRAGQHLSTEAYKDEADALQLLGTANGMLNNLHNQLSIKRPRFLSELLPESFARMDAALKAKGLTGVPSGIASIDKLTGGWQKSDLIILAARPGMGKTSLALNIARNAAIDFGRPVAFFSLEMGEEQLTTKLIATETKRTTSQLTKGMLDGREEELEDVKRDAFASLNSTNLVIDDTPALTVSQLRAKAARLKAEIDIQMIIVDYLQLMEADEIKGNREQQISSISRGLKLIAKELKVPVIALSQLSRSAETRGGSKKPILSDLRESGAIEQDADVVCFVYRAEYYKLTEDEMGNPTAGTAEVEFAKHRNGALETILLGCKMKYGYFYDLEFNPDPATAPAPANNFPNSDFDNEPPF